SSTAAAAYRAGVCITDERTGEVFDYTRKGGVEHSEIIVPEKAHADLQRMADMSRS
ncbi:MAG TPA: conjugal transfer protein TraA, partial [Thauera sp.]|nr:conjugal transfer protein TraA [Thauera sp.]